MEMAIALMAGLLAGAAAAWYILRSRTEVEVSRRLSEQQREQMAMFSEAEGRAKGAEAEAGLLRKQAQEQSAVTADLRSSLDAERQAKTEALTRIEGFQKSFEEQKELIESMKREMVDTFNALSAAALKSNNEDFLRLASERLDKVTSDTKGKLGEHQAALDGMIKPLSETLKRYEEQLHAMEQSRHKAYGGLQEQLRALATTHEKLQTETSNLVSALRRPEVRGRWGEIQLRRVAELAGMSAHCDFEEQVSVDTEKGRLRPDMTVKLPGDRLIVVDAKVSLAAYLDALEAAADEEKKAKLIKHGQQVRMHMTKLASKDYASQFAQSPEFVVMFIPGEAFLGAALDHDTTLIEDGIQKGVIIATPTTFIALLRAIAFGWRQEQVTKNAQIVSSLGKELYERMSTVARHLGDLGSSIGRSMDTYNKLVGSMETRVLPTVRKFRELGVSAPEEIAPVEQLDKKPRNLSLLDND